MRIIFNIIFLLFLNSCDYSKAYPWTRGVTYEEILLKSTKKTILIDFETEWCGWCKKLDENTYTNSQVIAFAKSNLLSIKIDAEKGEGIGLAKKYNVTGFPTIIFTDDSGSEIDRVIGYRDPQPFLKELKRIVSNKMTVPALEESILRGKKTFNNLFLLTQKYKERGQFDKANQMLDNILQLDIDSSGTAYFYKILFESEKSNSYTALLKYIKQYPESGYFKNAMQQAMYIIRKNGNDPELESELYYKLIEKSKEDDFSLLNSYSWRMSQLEVNLDIALQKIIIAINGEKDLNKKHMYIDTKAEVLWKMGRIDEALIEIQKCLVFSPDDKYYKEQFEKFNKKNS